MRAAVGAVRMEDDDLAALERDPRHAGERDRGARETHGGEAKWTHPRSPAPRSKPCP